jgi:Cu-Zn family superoxide dismutase
MAIWRGRPKLRVRMRGIVAAGMAIAALAAGACGYQARQTPVTPAQPDGAAAIRAITLIRDAQNNVVGQATFQDTRNGVRMDLSVQNLPGGDHGVHVHASGRCDPPEFMTAGAHFNPDARRHGLESREGPHAGDFPNLRVGSDGKGSLTAFNEFLVTNPGASNSLLKDGGTTLVIHVSADDHKTDPSGNSGARIACGVIQRSS